MRSILITGGAGYFGRAFVKRLLDWPNGLFATRTQRVCIYSRNEWNQAQMRSQLGDDPRLRWLIGDIRDQDRMRRAMHDVDVVIHAAALKRIETVEYNIMEAVATNVMGTENVVNAAIDAGVARAVLLSTDKACNPTTTYGMTKAVAERIFQNALHYAGPRRTRFTVCRYGNVAGSTGSVIPVWRNLMASGDTIVPMTLPTATRFWMTVGQAIDLVAAAIVAGEPGQMMIPTLPAYALGDLAEAMGASGARRIAMGEGEKEHEEMQPGHPSNEARRMTVEELMEALRHV